MAAGLFWPLATAWHSGDYRAVSIKLALMSLGATAAQPQGALRGLIRWRSRTQPQNEPNEQLLRTSAGGPSSSQRVVTCGSGFELAGVDTYGVDTYGGSDPEQKGMSSAKLKLLPGHSPVRSRTEAFATSAPSPRTTG